MQLEVMIKTYKEETGNLQTLKTILIILRRKLKKKKDLTDMIILL